MAPVKETLIHYITIRHTVCPGSSDTPEKNIKYICIRNRAVYTIF